MFGIRIVRLDSFVSLYFVVDCAGGRTVNGFHTHNDAWQFIRQIESI